MADIKDVLTGNPTQLLTMEMTELNTHKEAAEREYNKLEKTIAQLNTRIADTKRALELVKPLKFSRG